MVNDEPPKKIVENLFSMMNLHRKFFMKCSAILVVPEKNIILNLQTSAFTLTDYGYIPDCEQPVILFHLPWSLAIPGNRSVETHRCTLFQISREGLLLVHGCRVNPRMIRHGIRLIQPDILEADRGHGAHAGDHRHFGKVPLRRKFRSVTSSIRRTAIRR